MPFIHCPKCNKPISNRANTNNCPNCGCLITSQENKLEKESSSNSLFQENNIERVNNNSQAYKIKCPKCKKVFFIKKENIDSKLKCPTCGLEIKVSLKTNNKKRDQNGKITLASWSMILGLTSFFCSIFTAVPAIILGHISLSKIKKTGGSHSDKNKALIGVICGYIAILILVIISNISNKNKTIKYTKIYGSKHGDFGKDIIIDVSNNVYVCGYTDGSFDGQSNPGSTSLCLTKYDSNGTKQWTRIWGAAIGDEGRGISVDLAGNIYVCGFTEGSFNGQGNPGKMSLCLTKYDSSGNKQWTRIWGSAKYDIGMSVCADTIGNIYVCGSIYGSLDRFKIVEGDLCLTKYDSNGNKQWTRIWGSSETDYGNGVSVDSAGNVYVCGSTKGSFDGQSNPGGTSLCLTKYDSNGNKKWTRIWGSLIEDSGNGIFIDSADNIYVCGSISGHLSKCLNMFIAKNSNLCLTKYDSNGNKQWTRIWGATSDNNGNGVSGDNFGNVYVCGTTEGSFDGQINPGSSSLCLTKYDSNGNKHWSRIFGSVCYDHGNSVSVDSAGNVYVCGATTGSFDGQKNPGHYSICLTKFDSNGNKQ